MQCIGMQLKEQTRQKRNKNKQTNTQTNTMSFRYVFPVFEVLESLYTLSCGVINLPSDILALLYNANKHTLVELKRQ